MSIRNPATTASRASACIAMMSIALTCGARAHAETVTYSQAERCFLEKDYGRAVAAASRLIDERSPKRDELYYLKGASELKMNRYAEARASFKALVDHYGSSRRAFDAYVGIGDSYRLAGNVESAIRSYQDVVNIYAVNENIGSVYYRLSECYRASGNAERASFYAQKARRTAPYGFESREAETVPAPHAAPGPSSGVAHADERKFAPQPVRQAEADLFTVQVGSFKNRRNAQRIVETLSKQGFNAIVEESQAGRTSFYRVKVGRCGSADEAEQLAKRLKRFGYSARICSRDVCQQ